MKIAVIGGAGVRTVIFINGLLKRYEKLKIDEVVLYDINQEKLEVIGKLCKYVVDRNQEKLMVRTAENPVEAITGADYIVTTLRVGGDHSRVVDETVALEHGVIGQETTGIGGFSMAVRTIPVLVEYCEMISKYAPNAWIFNFTNPSGLVTQALRSKGYDRIIGICDAPSSTKFRMANYLGIEESDLYVEFFGLNHLSWIRSVKLKHFHTDLFENISDKPEIFMGSSVKLKHLHSELSEDILQELIRDDKFLQSIQEFAMFDKDVFKMTGFLPNEYLYYYYHREKALDNIIKSGVTRGKTIEEVNKKMEEELKAVDIDKNPEGALQIFLYYMQLRESSYMNIETGNQKENTIQKGNLQVPDGMGYAGVMLDCIEGMQSEEGKYLVLSVSNQGSIPGLLDEDVVETTCLVSNKGIQPVKIEEVPECCYLLMHNIKLYERLAVEAIFSRSKEKAAECLMLHPLVNSFSLAKELVEAYSASYDNFLDK